MQNIKNLKYPIGKFVEPIFISSQMIKKSISTLADFPKKIQNLVHSLTIEELSYKYRSDGWDIKQVVHHCADSHTNALIRFKLALTENAPIVKPYQEDKWAELLDSNESDLYFSLKIIEAIHHKWVLILKNLSQLEHNKFYLHPEHQNNQVLKNVLVFYAHHCNHHFAHIENAIIFKNKF